MSATRQPPEILVVDDNFRLLRNLAARFEREGYRVRTARDGEEALAAIAAARPDLVLLDVDMPRLGGIPTCERIRLKDRLLPVLFLTAYDDDVNAVRAFGAGADDYLSKDSSDAVLLASVRRALERMSALDAGDESEKSGRSIGLAGLTIDFDTLTICGKGVDERMTRTEADFLYLLNSERGRVFSYGEIFEILRGGGYVGNERTLQSHVRNLRRKLGPACGFLTNERGVGYSLLP